MSDDDKTPARDVIAGYVSVDAARDHYGVVLEPGTLAVDETATRDLRARRRSDPTRERAAAHRREETR